MAPENALNKKGGKSSRFSRFINENIFVILAFVCSAALMMIVYYCFDVIPFGDKTILRMDLFHQYGPLFAEFYDRLTELKSFVYSWTSGTGSSFLGNYFNYLSSPIAIIVLLFGHENIPESIGAMVLIKNALAAAAMAYYLKKVHGKNDFSVSAFGIMYSFCGFFIAYYWNVMWIDAMYLLPLVALGIEKIINERKAKLYIAALALTFFANYYMAFMVCIFAVLYYIVYYFGNHSIKEYVKEPRTKDGKDGKQIKLTGDCIKYSSFLRSGLLFAFGSVLAAALTAFALVPTYYILQACSATSGTMPTALTSYNTVFDFLANHLASVVPTIRSSGDTVLPNVYSGLLTLMLVPLYLMCKKIPIKEKIFNTALLGIFFFSFNFNIPNFIIHAFHFPNDLPFRFSFIYSFFIITIAYKALVHIKEFTGKDILACGIALVGFIVIVEEIGQGNVTTTTVAISVIFTVLYTLVLWLMKNPSYYQPTVALLLMCCVFAEAAIANTNNFEITQVKPNFTNGYSEFRTMKKSLDEREGGDGYRMELTDINTLMDNCWFGYNGVSVFSSMAYEKVANMQKELGMKSNFINSYVYNKQTPVYNAMMSLKYIVDNDKSDMNDSFYKYVSTTGNFSAYENKYYLPIAYCATSALKDWDSSSPNDPFTGQSEYWHMASGISADIYTMQDVADVQLSNLNDMESSFDGTTFKYSKIDSAETATVTVTYINSKAGNVYTYIDSRAFEKATVSCGDFSAVQDIGEPYILDLGYHDEGEAVTIEMTIDKDHSSGNIECYVATFNEEEFSKGYKVLASGGLDVKEFKDTYIKGTLNASSDCVLYTSIPYDEGWTVTVDGKKAETYGINDGTLLAVDLSAGTHEIEFSYTAKGLMAGICISSAALLFVVVYLIAESIVKKKRKKAMPKQTEDSTYEKETLLKDIMGIDALMAQDLGPNATEEDSEALLAAEREIVIEDLEEEPEKEEEKKDNDSEE